MKPNAQKLLVLLFTHPKGLTDKQILEAANLTPPDLTRALNELKLFLTQSGLTLVTHQNSYQLAAKQNVLPKNKNLKITESLSSTALEVLAIIAYRQPITRGEIEEIRGVGSEHTLRNLLERNLIIEEKKRKDGVKYIYYRTTAAFLHHVGLRSIKDLPALAEK